MMSNHLTVVEAAKIKNVTRQAIYLAIRLNKLKAYRVKEKLTIFRVDLDKYDSEKYSRENMVREGKYVYDANRGYISILKASEMLNVSRQKIYYAVRKGELKARRVGSAWVLSVHDLIRYENVFLKKELTNPLRRLA